MQSRNTAIREGRKDPLLLWGSSNQVCIAMNGDNPDRYICLPQVPSKRVFPLRCFYAAVCWWAGLKHLQQNRSKKLGFKFIVILVSLFQVSGKQNPNMWDSCRMPGQSRCKLFVWLISACCFLQFLRGVFCEWLSVWSTFIQTQKFHCHINIPGFFLLFS